MTATAALDAGDRRAAFTLGALLLVTGVLVGASPIVGVVTTADSSPTDAATIAAFTAVLPGLLALGLAVRGPALGLAATAGAGLIGMARFFADLSVITETDAVTRPELFYETTDRARPFSGAAGGWLLLAADVLMVLVGVFAAGRLGRAVSEDAGPEPAALFASQAIAADPPAGFGDPPPGAADPPLGFGDPPPEATDGSVVALSAPPRGRTSVNLPMIAVGFLGAVLLMIGALETPYSGGYLTLRVLPLGSSVTGVLAAALLPLLAAVAVLVAGVLARPLALALLAGTALAAAVPFLTAVVVVLLGTPTSVSSSVWWGLAGAIVLAGSGLLARRPVTRGADVDGDGRPPPPLMSVAAGVLALLAAAASFAASRASLLQVNGQPPDDAAAVLLAPAGLPFLVAAVPVAVAGALLLVPQTARVGRAALPVLWAGPVYALAQALWLRSRVVASAENPLNAGLPGEVQRTWSAGPGLWLGVLAVSAAVPAAVLAVITARRIEDASLEVVDDDSLAGSRTIRVWSASGLTVLTLIAFSLPAYSYLGRSRSSTLLVGYDLDSWGMWAVAGAVVGAVWAAALTRRPSAATGHLLAAAAVVIQPLIVPGAVREEAGFTLGAGFFVGAILLIALVAAAPVFAALAARVRTAEVASWSGDNAAQEVSSAAPAAARAVADRRPAGRTGPAGPGSKGR